MFCEDLLSDGEISVLAIFKNHKWICNCNTCLFSVIDNHFSLLLMRKIRLKELHIPEINTNLLKL